ncbi:MAG: hypothetical protein QXV69_10175 [Sulfolobaceae archaeon]
MALLKDVIDEVFERARDELATIQKEEFEKLAKEFLDSDFSLKFYPNPDAFYIDFTLWYGLYYKNPKTNTTILEEVLRKFDKETVDKVKNMKIVSGNFSIRGLRKINNEYFLILFNSDKGEFVVKTEPHFWEAVNEIRNTYVLGCHIVNYGGKYYLFGVVEYIPVVDEHGLLTPVFIDKAMERVDSMMLKKVEDVNVTERTTLKQSLSKYPAAWINEICDALNIKGRVKKEKINVIVEFYLKNTEKILEKLPNDAIEVLRLVLKKGGVVKYGELSKKFMDDTTYFHHDPKTPLGILRFYCLIFIGKINIKGKNYKVAIIPSDLREVLKKYIK